MVNLDKIVEKFEKINLTKTYLLIANVFLVFVLILFFNLGRLPFGGLGDFVFFSVIIFALALYRPAWAFLFFVGSIVIENVNLSPAEIGINVRPYQLIGAFVVLGVVVKHFSKRLNFKLLKMRWYDWTAIIFALSGFLSSFGALDKSVALKQSVIILSFVLLYFLVRNFAVNLDDLKKMSLFFFGSSFVVVFYSIWQNWMFQIGANHFEVMPGRPNATFSEPDWLGMFLVFVIAMFLPLIFKIKKRKELFWNLVLWISLVLGFVALVLTVARSAWLGAFVVVGLFLLATLIEFDFGRVRFRLKLFFDHLLFVLSALIAGFLVVVIFNLTNFELGGRAVSTASGLQEITIACEKKDVSVPDVVESVEALKDHDCKHINLEDIERFENEGKFVTTTQRKDPNVNIRAEIYRKSWSEIKNHPILGIGWGNISQILGTDERGAGLNSSNIFLEVWLGAGLLGLICFLVMIGNVFFRGIVFLKEGREMLGMIFVLGVVAILVPNMFNAGIMLGFLWVFLGLSGVDEN